MPVSPPELGRCSCRDLGFRSALIVPFMLDGQSIGLVELLAAEPHHFNDDDVLFLNDVAGVVLEANGLSVATDLIERAISSETDVPVDVKDVVTDLMLALEEQRPESSTVSIMPEITDAVIREQIEFIEKTNAAPVIAKPQLSFAVRSIPVRQVNIKYADIRTFLLVTIPGCFAIRAIDHFISLFFKIIFYNKP